MTSHLEDFRKRPKTFNFAKDVVDRWASTAPQSEAMYWVSDDMSNRRSMTFQYFSRQSHRIAVLLEKLGVRQGEVLIIVLPRVPAWWEIALAAIRSGVILSPAPTLLSAKDIQYRCDKSKATVFVGDSDSVRKFEAIRSECPSVKTVIRVGGISSKNTISLFEALEEVAQDAVFSDVQTPSSSASLIYFTSGTSGPPKMVLHNQISYPLALASTAKHWYQLEPGKLLWNTADQGWGKASWSFFGAWQCGASLFVYDDRRPFNVRRLLDILHAFPITTICAPPLAWRQLVLQEARQYYSQHKPRALSLCTAAGEALNDEVLKQWKQLSGLEIHEGYGQTETILLCGNFSTSDIRPGSMGKPAPGVPLHIIDADGRICEHGQEGNIAVKLSKDGEQQSGFFGLFDGYISDDGSVTRREQRYHVDGVETSWYLTGDKAKGDKDGYFWFVGRADDVINSAGYRIGPFEVESTLKQHPSVAESAVISSPDPTRGEVVKAFVVLTSEYRGVDPQELARKLQDFCKANAAPYKYPRKIEFVGEDFLPKTVTGKIQRNVLRKLEWQDQKARL